MYQTSDDKLNYILYAWKKKLNKMVSHGINEKFIHSQCVCMCKLRYTVMFFNLLLHFKTIRLVH